MKRITSLRHNKCRNSSRCWLTCTQNDEDKTSYILRWQEWLYSHTSRPRIWSNLYLVMWMIESSSCQISSESSKGLLTFIYQPASVQLCAPQQRVKEELWNLCGYGKMETNNFVHQILIVIKTNPKRGNLRKRKKFWLPFWFVESNLSKDERLSWFICVVNVIKGKGTNSRF